MARTGEEQERYTQEDYDNLQNLIEQTYSPAMGPDQTPRENEQGAAPSGSGGVGQDQPHQQPTSTKTVTIPKLAGGVALQTFSSNLRGVFGEKTRDALHEVRSTIRRNGTGQRIGATIVDND